MTIKRDIQIEHIHSREVSRYKRGSDITDVRVYCYAYKKWV